MVSIQLPRLDDKVRIKYNDKNYYLSVMQVSGNIVSLYDYSNKIHSSLTLYDNKWFLPGNISVSEVYWNETCFDSLGIYEKLAILIRAEPEIFANLCCVNRELYAISSGKLTEEIKLAFADITHYLYNERIDAWYNPEFKKFRDKNMTTKELYKSLYSFYRFKREHGVDALIRKSISTGNIFNTKIIWEHYQNLDIINESIILTFETVIEWFNFIGSQDNVKIIPAKFEAVTKILQMLAKKPYNLTPYKKQPLFYFNLQNKLLIRWLVNKGICTIEELQNNMPGSARVIAFFLSLK